MLYRLSYMSAVFLTLERVAGIEPAYSAWKADVLPLNYTRCVKRSFIRLVEGGGFEPPKLARQIYSLIPLATREPLRKAAYCPDAPSPCQPVLPLKLSTYDHSRRARRKGPGPVRPGPD